MKKILLVSVSLALVFSTLSCNDRLEGDVVQDIAPVKIDSVKIAQDTMDVFTTQSIKTYSNYTENCEGFYGYDYLHNAAFERKVISYKFKTDGNCLDSVTKISQINFRPQMSGTYLFRFFSGKDAAGENIFIEKNIVVQ